LFWVLLLSDPLVSILWLNYNSSSFLDIVLESLGNIGDLDYPNYELIVVDNGSTDGSFETIKEVVEKMNLKSKIIKLERNLGFTGGNNVAYRARSSYSKYVLLLNNDAVPYPDSLGNLVEVMENNETLGSAQGIILNYDEKSIDTAGGFDSEFMTSYLFLNNRESAALRRELYISHANGAYAIYRVKAVQKAAGARDEILDEDFFCLREDDLIGFRLWNAGFKNKSFPFTVAKHKRGSTFGKLGLGNLYLSLRNWLILNEISNSRYKIIVKLMVTRYGLTLSSFNLARRASVVNPPVFLRTVQKAIIDARKIGEKKKRLGELIDIYKAPLLKVKPSIAVPGLSLPFRIINREILRELQKVALLGSPKETTSQV